MTKAQQIRRILQPHIAATIKAKRQLAGITQRSLGLAVDYKDGATAGSAVCLWEDAVNAPSLYRLYLLAAIFDCPLSDFLLSKEDVMKAAGLNAGIRSITIKQVPFIESVPTIEKQGEK